MLDNGLLVLDVECNALNVVHGLKERSVFADNTLLLNDVSYLLKLANCTSCCYIHHSGNKAAHVLGNLAFYSSRDLYWIVSCPRLLSFVVPEDLS